MFYCTDLTTFIVQSMPLDVQVTSSFKKSFLHRHEAVFFLMEVQRQDCDLFTPVTKVLLT